MLYLKGKVMEKSFAFVHRAACTPRPVALLMIFYGVNFPADAFGLSDAIWLISGLIGFNFAKVACVSRHPRSK